MRIAVIGDAAVRFETVGEQAGGVFHGGKTQVLAGGVGAVSTILTENKATSDVYCDGPGGKGWTWISELFRQVTKNNRIVWSNNGNIAVQTAGLDVDGGLVNLGVAHCKNGPVNGFQGLAGLLDDVARYDAVVVCDRGRGTLNGETEATIAEIVRQASFSVVDSATWNFHIWQHAAVVVSTHDAALSVYGTSDPYEIRQAVGCRAVFVVKDWRSVAMSYGNETACLVELDSGNEPYLTEAREAFLAGVALGLGGKKGYTEAAMLGLKMAQAGKVRKSPLR